MARVVIDNTEAISVPCSNFTKALGAYGLGGQLISPPHLLICDVEGADERVIAHYFRVVGVPPQVLIYEHTHLLPQVKERLASFLRGLDMLRLSFSSDVLAHAASVGDHRLVAFLNVSVSPASANHVWVRRLARDGSPRSPADPAATSTLTSESYRRSRAAS